MCTVTELMRLEKQLLELNENNRFDIPFGDYIILQNLLKEIGRITNYYFYLQEEYFRGHGDKDKLKEYHDRLTNDEIIYDTNYVEEFIKKVQDNLKQ